MLTTTMLVMVIAVVAVLFGGLALFGRARGRTHSIGSDSDMSWSPAFYSANGGGDLGGDSGNGDSGCDAGGGSDAGVCDAGGGGSD
jgi:hypothetical protein